MDSINLLRTLVTLVSFIVFVAIAFWAWAPRQKSRFDAAANLPFADETAAPHPENRS